MNTYLRIEVVSRMPLTYAVKDMRTGRVVYGPVSSYRKCKQWALKH